MFKKAVIFVILFSMTLHAFNRLGFLSYLYQQRHQLAYTIGLIAEVPITICSTNHNNDGKLNIQEKSEHQSLPPVFSQAREIVLFFDTSSLSLAFQRILLTEPAYAPYQATAYLSPTLDIFQPPRI